MLIRGTLIAAIACCCLVLSGCPATYIDATKAAYAYVDENGDGICDTCGLGIDADGDGVCDNYVDADNDGVCDNRQSHEVIGWHAQAFGFVDENGDGICDVCRQECDADGDGVCDNFVDVDGDGICDNRQSHAEHGYRHGQTKAQYRFIDDDGDGVCDLCGAWGDGDGDGICDGFVDEDGDGICDNRQLQAQAGQRHGAEKAQYRFRDGNGDGICDGCGLYGDGDGDGVCDGFVDEDGDGICDNQQLQARTGARHGSTKARYGFVDGNGDGICDGCGLWCDNDGDGICDGFIDEDGDGICDLGQTRRQLGLLLISANL